MLFHASEFLNSKLLTKAEVKKAIEDAISQIDANMEYFKDKFPWPATKQNKYEIIENIEWTDGFWTGLLWLAYEYTNDEKYKVTLYSVKHDTDDILTEAFFDKEFFREDTIKELCDIFTKDAVLVASKTDNMPNDLADYLVIDNQDNAIKFMGCKKEIIEIAKAYL